MWARRREKGGNRDFVKGPKVRQLTLSMGPARAEVYKEPLFQVRGLFIHLTFIITTHAIIFDIMYHVACKKKTHFCLCS